MKDKGCPMISCFAAKVKAFKPGGGSRAPGSRLADGGASVVDDPQVPEREHAGLAGTGARACRACRHLNRLGLAGGGGGHSTISPSVSHHLIVAVNCCGAPGSRRVCVGALEVGRPVVDKWEDASAAGQG